MPTQLKAIAFDSDIARLAENFTGRQWVFDEIDRWLKESGERFFILTGEPGVGKSAIAARLTQIRDDIAAYHFCRAGDVETVRPARILRSLAAQLGEHLTDYGQALANTIKPIHLRVEVNITIGSMTGSQVTGVYIENMKESDPENELDILIRAPLEELQKMYTERSQAQPTLAIILIDSLDEAVTTTGTNLVKLLTQLSKSISLPSWVRFVMTSRPERRVLRGFEPLKPYHLQEKSDASLADVQRYVEDRFEQPALRDRLQGSQMQPQTLIKEITNLSHGNFLYTTLLLNDIEAGRQALDNLAALPKSIDDIYHDFLSRFSEEDWSDRYKPIFGVLTVAQEPISEKQISNFTKIDSEDVRDSIRIARQFFDVEIDEQNKETYSIFHQSLRDYLLDEDRNSDFWCNERKQHQRIEEYYLNYYADQWSTCDDYGLSFVVQHLVAANLDEQKLSEALNKVFTSKFMDARLHRSGWHLPFLQDLQKISTLNPERVAAFCLNIIYGLQPISLVVQKVLHLLVELRQRVGKIGRVSSKLDETIDSATAALSKPSEEAIVHLQALLKVTKNPRVQSFITLALGETGSVSATSTLLSILKVEEYEDTVRWAAADALISLSDRTIIDELINWFDEIDKSRVVGNKRRIFYILGQLRAEEARPLVSKGINSKHPKVVGQAIDFMGSLKPTRDDEAFLLERLEEIIVSENSILKKVWSDEWVQKKLVMASERMNLFNAKPLLKRFHNQVAKRPQPQLEKQQHQRDELLESIEHAIQALEHNSVFQ